MCSRSQCHRLWWMARRRFSHETQIANCLPSGLVKTKGKNSSIFSVGYQLYDSFSLWLTSLINFYTFLMCGLKIGSTNLHSKWSWVCAAHPGGTEMGYFIYLSHGKFVGLCLVLMETKWSGWKWKEKKKDAEAKLNFTPNQSSQNTNL